MKKNIDDNTVAGFGDEWSKFDQSRLEKSEQQRIFDSYFSIFPFESLPAEPIGADIGCGSGRWAEMILPKVGRLHCIEPSDAFFVAKQKLSRFENAVMHHNSLESLVLEEESLDFAYSLGVLHHIPDTSKAIKDCVAKLKKGAPILIYLYYRFENKPTWFKLMWRCSDLLRRLICFLPKRLKFLVCDLIALLVYLPLSKLSLAADRLGIDVRNIPLSTYRELSFYTMRTDSLDRFGTRLEQRFSKCEIKEMMENSGLENVVFSQEPTYWIALGYRKLD